MVWDLSSEMHGVKVQGAVGCRVCKPSVFPSLGRNVLCAVIFFPFLGFPPGSYPQGLQGGSGVPPPSTPRQLTWGHGDPPEL